MAYKKKADCTPEEWTEFLEKSRQYRESHREQLRQYDRQRNKNRKRKRKEDYTKQEWDEHLQKQREYRATHHIVQKRKTDYTEEEWKQYLEKQKIYRLMHPRKQKTKKDYTEDEWRKKREYEHQWRIKNKDKVKEREKKWREKNKEKCKEIMSRYKEKHIDVLREKQRISKQRWRETHREEDRERVKKYQSEHPEEVKERNKNWTKKVNYYQQKVKYSTYAKNLTVDEDPIPDDDGFLMCRDFHTKQYFYPTRSQIRARIGALNGTLQGENHLYSSEESKKECPVYRKSTRWDPNKTKKKQIPIDSFWRQTVIERANGHCERCGKASDVLHAHHIIPKGVCGMFEEDFDNGIALCPECHLGEGGVHDMDGCRLHELAAEKRKTA